MNNKNGKYPPESAGRKMIANVPTAGPDETIAGVRKKLFEKAKEFETLNYIYVLSLEGKLEGVLSLKDVFRKPASNLVKELMAINIIKVRPYADQEKVAILALRHNLKAIPVVDKENIFFGVVPSDVILEILHSEDVEDILHFAGISKNNSFANKIFQASPFALIKLRLPWLLLGLLGGLLAAQIVGFFEESLRNNFILAAFIPLIVYMADAVGTQTETLFIRSLVYHLDIKNYFLKEIKVGFSIALILGMALVLISCFFFNLFPVGIILGISLFFTIVSAFLLGLLVPYFLNKLKKDPAVASGPLGTIIRDILSLMFYFLIASSLLKFFGA
ncbi:MAG: magnesium transporter [bacterium]|nr:magnesium transporter [bacterium]